TPSIVPSSVHPSTRTWSLPRIVTNSFSLRITRSSARATLAAWAISSSGSSVPNSVAGAGVLSSTVTSSPSTISLSVIIVATFRRHSHPRARQVLRLRPGVERGQVAEIGDAGRPALDRHLLKDEERLSQPQCFLEGIVVLHVVHVVLLSGYA